jgi:hypothetical protein
LIDRSYTSIDIFNKRKAVLVIFFFFKLTKKARGRFSDSSECMSVSYCMLTVVIWWCLCCYLLIIYCNKLYKSFCFWWWNRNEKQKYNTDINICTNKSGPPTFWEPDRAATGWDVETVNSYQCYKRGFLSVLQHVYTTDIGGKGNCIPKESLVTMLCIGYLII